MELARLASTNLDLSVEATVLTYAYAGQATAEVIARVDIGDVAKPIVGDGNYILNFYLNDVPIVPLSVDPVPAGRQQAIAVSRPIPVYPGDVIKLTAQGRVGDTQVDTLATLRTATPIQAGDIFGAGPIPVDHNYGGANNLAYQTAGGAPIPYASVTAYLQNDYNAGRTSVQYVQARTTVTVAGGFASPLMLAPGTTYVLVYQLAGAYGPNLRTVSVA